MELVNAGLMRVTGTLRKKIIRKGLPVFTATLPKMKPSNMCLYPVEYEGRLPQPKSMNFWQSFQWGDRFEPKTFLCGFSGLFGAVKAMNFLQNVGFWPIELNSVQPFWSPEKSATLFSKNRGGHRPFGSFPTFHCFLLGWSSLTSYITAINHYFTKNLCRQYIMFYPAMAFGKHS